MTTAPFPGFPTDLQAQFMALMTQAPRAPRASPRRSSRTASCTCRSWRGSARASTLDGQTATIEGVEQAQGRAGDGDRPARLGVAGDRGARRRRRDHGQPRLSPRPRLRAAGGQARRAAAPRSSGSAGSATCARRCAIVRCSRLSAIRGGSSAAHPDAAARRSRGWWPSCCSAART